ncbi:DUF1569 domain-containing protein [Polaribacter sp. Asnod6-C07]|uniref:DUF1569 domain-containing protein n=1 Tax=Polaribacter sp. Asnod6-C07 TaxID=3160582 RepID=UPI00386F0E86
MHKELKLIEDYLIHFDKENSKISKANVGWHLDHSLKVVNSVSEFLINSDPKAYKKTFSFSRVITFALGIFPRGKVQAPKRVLPPESILKKDLVDQIELVKINLKLLENIENNKYFVHPIFKQLNKKQALQFLKIHTNHHLKIVKDILN